MIEANFTYNSENEDYAKFLEEEYSRISQAINDSSNFTITTNLKYLGITNIENFSDKTWKLLATSKLGVREKAQLGLVYNSQDLTSQHDYLNHYIDRLVKRVAVLELEQHLLLKSDQNPDDPSNMVVYYRIEFKK